MIRVRLLKFLLLALIVLTAEYNSHAAKRRMLGPNFTMSWASSYLAIDSASVQVQNETSWTYASATGWFFDYLINPYISFRSEWFFYPSIINCNPSDTKDKTGEIPLHEIGFSILRHFNLQPINPWFGVGPFMQFSTINDANSYIVHAVLSTGFDYEVDEDTFFCPEIMWGIGARLLSSDEDTVQVNIPSGKDFTSSGIVIFFKLGVARSF